MRLQSAIDRSQNTVEIVAAPRERVRAQVEIHDRQQVEIELAYPLPQDGGCAYSAELSIFVPRNVGLSAQNYSREAFYGDVTAYLRLDSPPLTLAELADEGCALSPLHHLDQALTLLEGDIYARPLRPIVALVKLFGHTFRESVRAEVLAVRAQAQALCEVPRGGADREARSAAVIDPRAAGRKALLDAVAGLLRDGHEAVLRFRRMRRRFLPCSGARPRSVVEAFEHVDEYATAYFCEQLSGLAGKLQRLSGLHDGSCVVAAALQEIHARARRVAEERRREGFAYPDPQQARLAEFFTYRRGLIKKSMQQAFYLETRALRRDPFVRNAIGMVAAGLAAIWSVVAQVPGTLSDVSESTRLFVLGSAVVAYVLKDRIKEVSKEYLGQRLRSYDHDTAIVGENLVLLGLRGLIGRARERVRWTSPAELPEDLLKLRMHPRTVAGLDVSTEEVIQYTRALSMGIEQGQRLPAGFALRDILRLNLRHFMSRLDEPQDRVSYYDVRRERFLRVLTPKVYHLNMILRISQGDGPELLRKRYRVVLNKERILRVERVTPAALSGNDLVDSA